MDGFTGRAEEDGAGYARAGEEDGVGGLGGDVHGGLVRGGGGGFGEGEEEGGGGDVGALGRDGSCHFCGSTI